MNRTHDNSAMRIPSGRARIPVPICVFLCIALLVPGAQQFARAQAGADEYQVKAAFLFHFAQLAEWPAGAISSETQSVNLCVFDDEPRRNELLTAIDGKFIEGRVFRVRLQSQSQGFQGCNIFFLSHDEARRQAATLKILRGLPILTVGETPNFLSDGGMIRFHIEEGKIRFDISLGAADSSRLKISSRLLLLATSVTRDGNPDRGR
jgi:hypothetical protein